MEKTDRRMSDRQTTSGPDHTPFHQVDPEVRISELWKTVLGLPQVGLDDSFFEVGGTSLLAAVLLSRINQTFEKKLPIAAVFEYPTVRTMANLLRDPARGVSSSGEPETARPAESKGSGGPAVAIIGMTGRFPGAASVEEFWQNLVNGVESITFFDRSQLEARDQAAEEHAEGYIAARPILENVEMFDAAFFGVYPKEAEQMDPQHRVFLECAWEVLERAGYDPSHTRQSVGVFAGCSMNTYLMQNLAADRRFLEEFTGNYQVGSYVTMLGNDKDFLATRVSYKLNLHGPSITVQSACSTSLVAVCQACQSLLTDGCDMALAGAVSITFPQKRGYLPQEGGLASLDGHCRPFDQRASGTIFGHGAAVLLLKRLDEALADGDQVLGVIRGFAINNDGSNKVGYTAPSVEGQAQVIARAQKIAQVPASSITYIEAHGTGTPLGDPIEVAALTKAFRLSTQETGFCALGTAKANVGHLDVAAGATGLIKTVLQLEHRAIPKLLHFEQPSRHLDLANSPFFINREMRPWEANGLPLRAGVSAFGVGGTNAHVIVEESPRFAASESRLAVPDLGVGGYAIAREHQLLTWSAKSTGAATKIAANLAQHLGRNPGLDLADAAFTLQVSRSRHKHRRALVAGNLEEARQALSGGSKDDLLGEDHPFENASVVFCFPGQGVQSPGMGQQLYRSERVFRQHLDLCDEVLRPLLGESLLRVLHPANSKTGDSKTEENAADQNGDRNRDQERLNQTVYAQPSIFAIEYALAQLWISWGIRPKAMAGHSVGEYVAACLAGVLSLEDALRLIAARGRLMQSLAPGSMLAVRASEESVTRLIEGTELDLAAVNSPQLSVVSGSHSAIDAFSEQLTREQIQNRKLATSHAFHSRMVEPALAPFAEHVGTVTFGKPSIPYVSTLTGNWITEQQVSQPEYWTRQLRQTVRFDAAVRELLKTPQRILLEVGPGRTAAQMMRQTVLALGSQAGAPVILSSLVSGRDVECNEEKAILSALGQLWAAGAEPDWHEFHTGYSRKRILLPTYPFERKRYWAEPPLKQEAAILDAALQPDQARTPFTSNSDDVFTPEIKTETAIDSSEGPIMTVANPTSANPQAASMLDELKLFVTDLSGADLADVDGDASFLELGFDSLFLTQLTQAIQGKYRVKLTFRQIMESYPTLEALAAHLQTVAPPASRPSAIATPPAPLAAAPVSVPAKTDAAASPLPQAAPGSYETLFAAQMQMLSGLFQQQLELLRGQQAPGAAAVAVSAMPSAVLSQASAPVAANPSPRTAAAPAIEQSKAAKPTVLAFRPPQAGAAGNLNPVQEKYLQTFIKEYNHRTPGSKAFTQKYRSVFADGRVVSGFHAQLKELVYPLVVDRAAGAYLWDKDGNRYIDILNGFGAILYGHSPDFVVEAVRKQLDLGFPIGPQTELVGVCSELIRELTGVERVTFCNTGSEAVMGAMRIARTVTGRNLVVLFTGDYHGSFDEVLVKAVGDHRSMPTAPGIPRESVANILVLEYGAPASLEIIRQRAEEIAAVLVEPVQSRHPELRPLEFLREVRRITEQHGAALIFDEVVTGFRTAPGGMQALYGIRADLVTYGKVVAGGLPVGVLAGSAAYMDALDGGQWQFGDDSYPQAGVTFYAGTFMRHPLAMAAVKASLEHLKGAGASLQKDLAGKTSSLVSDIRSMFGEFSYPAGLETFSSWFFLSVPGEPRLARLLHFHLRAKGVHIQEGFPCFLTTAHTAADLDFIREAFHQSLRQMRAGQALGVPAHDETSVPLAPSLPAADKSPAATGAGSQAAAPAAQPVARDIPITEPQREILFGTQLGDEANCAFNESTSLQLRGPLNEKALIQSLETLIARHESLRSTVDSSGDTIHIAAEVPLGLEREDLSTLAEPIRGERLEGLLAREASTPFDLYNGPLFRVCLVRLRADEHLLVFTAHHIVFDGWSTNVVYRELSELYSSQVKGLPASLPAALTFHEYAIEQNRRIGTPEQATVESYWADQFKTIPAPLQLPTDRPRSGLRSNEGTTKRFVFPAETLQSIRKAGARQGSTLFATLLAGYSLLIHRLCQQSDIVVGIPMAGQSLLENGSTLVGHSVNFLPIRSSYAPDQTLSQFVKQTRKTLLDAQDHQDYTYGTLLRKLKIPLDPSRLQLVEVQFNLEQVGSGLKFDGLSVDLSANPKTSVNMDLFFNFVDRGTELWLDCDYNTSLFDAATIDRWFEHLQAILGALVENIDQPLADVSLLTAAQTEKMLVEWNQTATPYPREASIHRIFEEQVKLTPHAVAVVGERTLTYTELNEKANQLAWFLESSHVKPGARVALCLERSLEVIVSVLGILKAGAAYVPIDPSYPASRLTYLIEDSGAQVLLTERPIAANLPSLSTDVICLDADWPTIALQKTENPEIESGPEHLAYVMYTSGSTGDPKGVLVPQRAVLRLVKNNTFASFSPEEVFLQLAPLSFDAATFEIWGALLNGARLVMGPQGRLAPEEIGRLISAHGVTTLWLTAALFHLMATEHLEVLRPLRQLLAGGDVLSITHVRRVLEALPKLRLINGYGPTENTTFTCCHTITLESLTSGTVPIGRPIANTRGYMLDAARKPVPPGVAGQLYASGDGLDLGYLNAPQLTAEKFLDASLGKGLSERLYRTGDLARFRADGTVEFLGRADTQVKIRGYRIELAEIEYALEKSPLVRSAVVAVRSDWISPHETPGDKRLAAYVVPAHAGGDQLSLIQDLRKHLQAHLPEYMQPAAIMLLENLPQTLNGKVDRQALPAPQPEQLMRQRAMVYPRNAQEEALAAIWAKVLGLREVGVEESIFELGGDSLLIFRITTLANQAGLGVTARHIFQYRTVAAICAQLDDPQREAGAKTTGGIQPVPRSRYRRPQTILQ